MKKRKAWLAGLLACAVAASSLAGCTIGRDTSWVAKTETTTVPTGAYIYELYQAYSEARGQADNDDMKKAKIDDTDAFTWIENRAKQSITELVILEEDMQEKGLSFTSEEQDEIKQAADNAWIQQYRSVFDGMDIEESSFELAYAQRQYMIMKVFSSIYDNGGEKAVSEDDMRAYFEEHYADFDYTSVSLTTTDEDGNSTEMNDEQKAEVKSELDGYLSQIQAGTTTVKDASAAYAAAHDVTDNYQEATQDLDSAMATYYLPSDLISAIKEMQNGETRLLEISGTYYVLVTKNDITQKTDEYLSDQDNRTSLLYEQYGDEFTQSLEDEAASYEGIEWNDASLSRFTPELFYTEPVSSQPASSSTASETSSAAESTASETSSAAESTASETSSAAESAASETSSAAESTASETSSAAESTASETSSAA